MKVLKIEKKDKKIFNIRTLASRTGKMITADIELTLQQGVYYIYLICEW